MNIYGSQTKYKIYVSMWKRNSWLIVILDFPKEAVADLAIETSNR